MLLFILNRLNEFHQLIISVWKALSEKDLVIFIHELIFSCESEVAF